MSDWTENILRRPAPGNPGNPGSSPQFCLNQTDNRDLQAEIKSREIFFDRIASAWEEEHNSAESELKLQALVSRFDLKPGQHVLDAGCGSGRLLPLILKEIGPPGKLTAIDLSSRMLEIARKKHRADNLVFLQADVCCLEDRGQYDRIICLCLLPHLPDKLLALKSFRRYLKPNGQLIVVHTASRDEVNAYHSRLPEPICRDQLPDPGELKALLQAAGFCLIELEDSKIFFLRAIPDGKDD